MTSEDARTLVEGIRAAWNDVDSARVASFYAEDCESYDVEFDVPSRGRAAIAAGVDMYLRAFPDSTFTVENVIASGNTVVEQWVADGHHRGEIWGIPATGNYTRSRGCTVMELDAAGLVRRETSYWDSAGMYRQIGALTPRAVEPAHLA